MGVHKMILGGTKSGHYKNKQIKFMHDVFAVYSM